jgi:hypothetical protein
MGVFGVLTGAFDQMELKPFLLLVLGWASTVDYPNATPPDPEFYDYNPATTNNSSELGNDYFSKIASVQKTIEQYAATMGAMTPPPTGLIGSELARPLIGIGNDGKPLADALAAAQQAYYGFLGNHGCDA